MLNLYFYGKIEGYLNTSLRADRIVDIHKTLRPCLCCAIKFDMAQHGIGQLGVETIYFLGWDSFSVLAEKNIFQYVICLCPCCCQVMKVLDKKFATVQ